MKLLIYKTNIKTKQKVKTIEHLFENRPAISDWSIDLEDVDKVLRIEATENMNELELINSINTHGFSCEDL